MHPRDGDRVGEASVDIAAWLHWSAKAGSSAASSWLTRHLPKPGSRRPVPCSPAVPSLRHPRIARFKPAAHPVVLQGTVLVLASFFVIINLLVDVLQALIDPRIRR